MARIPAALAAGVVGNGLSPISNSTTSLPRAFKARAFARTVKAVSALRWLARWLSRGMSRGLPRGSHFPPGDYAGAESRATSPGSRPRRDRPGERLDDPGDDVIPDDLLADRALGPKCVEERAVGAIAPVLAAREIDADLVVAELAGADLEGVRPGLDREPGLEPARIVERDGDRGLEVEDLRSRDLGQSLERRADAE